MMARAIAVNLRRSSRIRQQMQSSSNVIASTFTPSSTEQQNRKPRQRKTKATTSAPTTPFPLLRLPREIRDMIYTLLVSNGHLAIQHTSREINLEVQSIFYRVAICRQDAGYCDEYRVFFSYNTPSELFQNFELHCDLVKNPMPSRHTMQTSRRRFRHSNFRSATYFGRSDLRRNRMTLELDFSTQDSVTEVEYFVTRLLDRPGRFIGFRHLVVNFPPMPSGWKDEDKTRIIQFVRDRLEPRLGPAVLHEGDGEGDDDGDCMEFHPWSLAGQQKYRLEPVWFLKREDWDGNGWDGDEDPDDE